MRVRAALVGVVMSFGLASAGLIGLGPAQAKTAKECSAEYSANKAAIKASQKKGDFIAACKAGTEVIPGAASAPTPAVPPATAATQPPTPASAPVAPPPVRTTRTAPVATGAPTAANEFTTEAQAKGRCPGATVVWINTKSKVYHFAGTRDYGNTKAGAYACEADATAVGDRAAKNEKHP